MPDAAVARAVLATDLALLAHLEGQIDAATAEPPTRWTWRVPPRRRRVAR
jgi:hypothetical protein